jgi:hypothetical protein
LTTLILGLPAVCVNPEVRIPLVSKGTGASIATVPTTPRLRIYA